MTKISQPLIIYATGMFHGLIYGGMFNGWLSRQSQRLANAIIGWVERKLGFGAAKEQPR